MARPTDPRSAALLDHVFQQTLGNINFLASQNYIPAADATELASQLTNAQRRGLNGTDSLASSMQALQVAPVPPPARRAVPPPQQKKQARAIWAYNEDGREPNDLSFTPGEVIEIVDETNADWWTGICRGKQGLFPSNHVEMIGAGPTPITPQMPTVSSPSYGPPQPYSAAPPPPQPVSPQYGAQKPVYRPFGAAYHGNDAPPPATVGAVNSVGLQQAPEPEKKPSRFGGLGNTMANSAAGGVGFGAGAAIGSGIVNAIF